MKKEDGGVHISVLGLATLLLTVACAAFMVGWALRGGGGAVRVTTQRSLTAQQQAPTALPTPAPSPGTAAAPAERVDINTADAAALQALPGIGAKRAADIIAYREAHGPFRVVEELTDVPGIGEATLAGLLDYITVSDGSGGAT